MTDLPRRIVEMAEAHAARQGPLTLEPEKTKDVILNTVNNILALAALSQTQDLPAEVTALLICPSLSILSHLGISAQDSRALCNAAMHDVKDLIQ